ncbi:hypothetical protein TanjilG_14831 [Lupinus angustifolius]|uniref:Uncharacterized protein n=1 Tax=Lupinus angustifolius TaxID=3871 RepID=A0A1J7HFU9_LUPAN|nr:PREDICTED: uncharacterized protein LOC109362401 [Lupinus angustifolius]OIW00605.1 hypothetical protein TanjilG_14831 [Lupinus angustifolius]
MPKFRRVKSPSVGRTSSYPYPSNPKNNEQKPMNLSGSVDDIKEWEEARCPICMEPPHNAVLLKCSSHEVGCRPFMCNTSHRHSNCLDQFCKTFASHLSSATLQEIPLTSIASPSSDVQTESWGPTQHSSQSQPKIICPLCRGEIHGYMVLEPARRYMNSISRSCSSETCEFQGTYPELRNHARSEHPNVRPSEVDSSRMSDWTRMEQERSLGDLFSSFNPSSDTEYNSETVLTGDPAGWMSFLDAIVFIRDASRMARRLSDRRVRVPFHDRRSATMHRVYETVTNHSAIWRSDLPHQYAQQVQGLRSIRRRTNSSLFWVETTHTARSRTNLSSLRMPRDVNEHHRDLNPGVRSSSRAMMQFPSVSHVAWANPQRNSSSSGRFGHQLRWRGQRWSTFNNQP